MITTIIHTLMIGTSYRWPWPNLMTQPVSKGGVMYDAIVVTACRGIKHGLLACNAGLNALVANTQPLAGTL